MQTGKLLIENEEETRHKDEIKSLVKSKDGSHFLTGSRDKSGKVLHLIDILLCVLFLIMCQFLYFTERSMFNYYFKFILQLWDTRTLTLLKTYVTQPPINTVAMSPLLDHVINLTLIMMLTIF